MCGGRRPIACRSEAGVSPERTSTRISGSARPAASASAPISASGRARFRCTSLPSAFSCETYTTSVRSSSPPARRPAPVVAPVTSRQVAGVAWILAAAALFAFTAVVIERKITWYLAVDQYGYLTFAHDLLHGRVFHHWPPLDAFVARIPPK